MLEAAEIDHEPLMEEDETWDTNEVYDMEMSDSTDKNSKQINIDGCDKNFEGSSGAVSTQVDIMNTHREVMDDDEDKMYLYFCIDCENERGM